MAARANPYTRPILSPKVCPFKRNFHTISEVFSTYEIDSTAQDPRTISWSMLKNRYHSHHSHVICSNGFLTRCIFNYPGLYWVLNGIKAFKFKLLRIIHTEYSCCPVSPTEYISNAPRSRITLNIVKEESIATIQSLLNPCHLIDRVNLFINLYKLFFE